MGKLFVFTIISLDGYFEAPDHDISWFNADDHHFEAFSLEQSREVDTLLFGRRTYEGMKSYWPTEYARQTDPEIAQFMNGNPKVVATHHPFEPDWSPTTVISGDIPAEVRALKAQTPGTIAIFGSNELCVTLMPHGLIDEFRIMVSPIALGAGTPLFKGLPQHIPLTLTDTRRFESGKVLLTYMTGE